MPEKQEPAAWLVFADDGSESSAVYMTEEEAQAAVAAWGWRMVPLYTAVTPAGDAQEAIGEVAAIAGVAADLLGTVSERLKELLERMK